jgi:HEPN domain-containing protein
MSFKQLEYRYQEADSCYKNGINDACCVMCRKALEALLKLLGNVAFGNAFTPIGKNLSELVNGVGCLMFKFGSREREAMMIIYHNGNQGAHSDKILDRQDANRSIQSLETLMRKYQQIRTESEKREGGFNINIGKQLSQRRKPHLVVQVNI